MSSPKLHIEGPFDKSESKYGPDVDLYLGTTATDQADTQTKKKSIPTQEDDKAVLAPISGQRSGAYRGDAVGNRFYQAGFGSNPKEGLVRWLIEFESLLQSEQGVGYKVIDDVRGETYDPLGDEPGALIEEVAWTYRSGEGVNAEWSLDFQVGDGMQAASDRGRYIDEETSRAGGIGVDRITASSVSIDFVLGDVEKRRFERSVMLDTVNIMHQYDVPVVGLAKTGVDSEFTIDGRMTKDDVDSLPEAARKINDDLHGETAVFEDAFTERTFEGAVSSTDTTFEEGRPNVMEYRITLDIGDNLAPGTKSG